MKFVTPFIHFVLGLGFFAPLVLGILDSSFLVIPFGNDLLLVGLVAHNPGNAAWYVLSAACGSTIGVFLLSMVARTIGETGVRRIAGEERFNRLSERIGSRASLALFVGGTAPPPFPFKAVVGVVAGVGHPIWRILVFTFLARAARFTGVAILAYVFGKSIMEIAKSSSFQWAMIVFIGLCAIASAFSIWRWVRRG